jgi:MraZ protein
MPGFSGKYYYTIDPKGRIIVPSSFREIISTNYSPKLYVVNALFDTCLNIFPQEEWLKLEEKVRRLPSIDESVQFFKRRVIASAQEVELDKQGRILISAAQREDAGLSADIVIAGALDKIEVWNRKAWDTAVDLSGIDRKSVAAKLSDYGI